jgi:hypothetical protein
MSIKAIKEKREKRGIKEIMVKRGIKETRGIKGIKETQVKWDLQGIKAVAIAVPVS